MTNKIYYIHAIQVTLALAFLMEEKMGACFILVTIRHSNDYVNYKFFYYNDKRMIIDLYYLLLNNPV